MFIPIPVVLKDGRQFESIPVANGLLVVANVLIFWMFGPYYSVVGPGTSLFSILGYAFSHAHAMHLVANMWVLLVFGTPLNRRLGNGYYLLCYLGCAVALGLFARLFSSAGLVGASGAIFAMIGMALLLLPSAIIEVFYFALFPVTLITGLLDRPRHWVFWVIRWDRFEIRAVWGLLLVPFLELWGLFWSGWNWTNLGHLFGLVCGVAAVLMLPSRVTMRSRSQPASPGLF